MAIHQLPVMTERPGCSPKTICVSTLYFFTLQSTYLIFVIWVFFIIFGWKIWNSTIVPMTNIRCVHSAIQRCFQKGYLQKKRRDIRENDISNWRQTLENILQMLIKFLRWLCAKQIFGCRKRMNKMFHFRFNILLF